MDKGIPSHLQMRKSVRSFFEELPGNDGYSTLKRQCDSTQTAVSAIYPTLLMFVDTSMLHALDQDSYSKTMIPSDVPEKLIPLKCYGDGNCLFRYFS